MSRGEKLEAVLRARPRSRSAEADEAVTAALIEMSKAAAALQARVSAPPLTGGLGALAGSANSDGDAQKRLDVEAEELFSAALRRAGIGAYLSEEVELADVFNPAGRVAVAIDPLDGSSNIDVNAPIGTIFSILPMIPEAVAEPAAAFRQTGRAQLAAGFFIYGPQTSLVVSLGDGVQRYTLDVAAGDFVLVETDIRIPHTTAEFAINASNSRHWGAAVQRYIEHCAQGAAGPRERNFNMRWVGSLVADAYRIFVRGGVFLYPGDRRPGYEQGRLRLMYEANPIAFLTEQAGGAATDGADPVLDRVPRSPHERSPLVMGSTEEVAYIREHHLADAEPQTARS